MLIYRHTVRLWMTKTNFINEISNYAKEANAKWGIPASAIIGMAVVESGYGTTRIAVQCK